MELPAPVKELYKRFCISENVGFLIENPVRKLPEKFQKWEELAQNVVDLLEQNEFRKSVEEELKIIGKPLIYAIFKLIINFKTMRCSHPVKKCSTRRRFSLTLVLLT
jgi:hypothetical protein